jgi:hypothetical protein
MKPKRAKLDFSLIDDIMEGDNQHESSVILAGEIVGQEKHYGRFDRVTFDWVDQHNLDAYYE